MPGQWHRYNAMTLNIHSQGRAAIRHIYSGHGIELAQPYYDRKLVEFVMAVPAYELGRPDYDRRIHRQAMKSLLPEAVRLRRRYTDFTPLLLKGMAVKEKETVRRIFQDPMVVRYKYIDGEWLANQLEKKFDLSEDSIRLWFALCLELWLKTYWT
jgi:asparagine synthase (glutamine-hydrolysing)